MLNEDVADYVKTLRAQGQQAAAVRPNSDTSLMKQELIDHYKAHPVNAQKLIDMVEVEKSEISSPQHSDHYNAACIAIRGYQPVGAKKSVPSEPVDPMKKEMNVLKANGWRPLNEQSPSVLLTE